jgi:DNA-binding HxlR family transcriptional regulator
VRSYGQYCPLAKAAEVFADRWTPLIVRELLLGVERFNDLERGLPGISRSVLAQRLRMLERAGVLGHDVGPAGRASRYWLTHAGCQLQETIDALATWGVHWAFREPQPEELDAGLLMNWISRRIARERLPDGRTVVRFDLSNGRRRQHFWLLLTQAEVAMCVENPGFNEDLVVSAGLADFYRLWSGRITYQDAISDQLVHVTGIPTLRRAFPTWLLWSRMADAVRSASAK